MKGLQWSYRLTVWFFRQVFPAVAKYEKSPRSYDELKREFHRWEIFIFGLTILFGVLTGIIWCWLFSQLGAWQVSRLPEAAIVLTASWLLWVPGLLMGVSTGALLSFLLVRLVLKGRYREYIAYQNQKFRVNNERLGPLLGVLFILGPIIILVMLLNWYVVFTPEQIVIKSLLSISERSYRYSDIDAIYTAPTLTIWTGKTVTRREYAIIFREGQKLTTNCLPALLTSEGKAKLLIYVSVKSGVPITEKTVLSKAEIYGY